VLTSIAPGQSRPFREHPKCKCDVLYEVPVPVPQASLLVVKTATPETVGEPGGPVTFAVRVENTGIDPNNKVTLSSLVDSVYGDVTSVHDAISATTCQTGIPISPGKENAYTCSFTAQVTGEAGSVHTDTVEAEGQDDRGNPVEGEDDATVAITDVKPEGSPDQDAYQGAGHLHGGGLQRQREH